MSQFRPPLNPEQQQQTRQYTELRDWVGDIIESPLDENGVLLVRQVFAFTVDMNDYPLTARGFGDTKLGDNDVENRKLLLWLFCYLCEAYSTRTLFPKLKPILGDSEDEEEEDDDRRATARKLVAKRRVKKRKTTTKEKKKKKTDDDLRLEKQQRTRLEIEQDREHKLIAQCEKFSVFIDDLLLKVQDRKARTRALAERLRERITGEDIETPKHWCAVEYVPSNEYDSSDRKYMADIFNTRDRYYNYNKLQTPPRACYWTFYFLTTSHYNFNNELSDLLFRNMMTAFRQPEAAVSLDASQETALKKQILSYKNINNVVSSNDEFEKAMLLIEGPKRADKRKRASKKDTTSIEVVPSSPKAKQNRDRERFPWRRYEDIGPKEFANMAGVYLGVPVNTFYQEHNNNNNWPHMMSPVSSNDSPLDANNLFSQATAVRCRALNVSRKQSLLFFSQNRVYFKPNQEHEESTDPAAQGFYRWKPPHRGRLLFFNSHSMTPSNMFHRNFPDRLWLNAACPLTELLLLLPKFAQRFTSNSKRHLNNSESSPAMATRSLPPPPLPRPALVGCQTYIDLSMLKNKLRASESRQLAVEGRVLESMGTLRECIPEDESPSPSSLFAPEELSLARREYLRYKAELKVYNQWHRAHTSVMSDFSSVSRTFTKDLIRLTAMPLSGAVPLAQPSPSTRRLSNPRAPFSLSRFLCDNNHHHHHHHQEYEAYNELCARSKSLWAQLRPLLQDKSNALTAKERYCLYKLYQKTLIHQWNVNARSSVAKLPDAARAIYKFIEDNDIYNPKNRPSHVVGREFDPSMNMLSNMLAWFLLHYRSTLNAARPDLLQLAFLAGLDASRSEFNIHLNLCLMGSAGASKSWTFIMMCLLRIIGTYRESTNQTDSANSTNSGAKLNYLVTVFHEMRRRRFMGEGEDSTGDPELKAMLDRGVVVTQSSQWNSSSRDWQEVTRVSERIGCIMCCTNLNLSTMDGSMFDRMVVINMPPGEMILTALLAEHMKALETQANYETQLYIHRWLQAVVHELWAIIGLNLVPPPTTVLLFICMHFVNEKMVAAGIRPFRPREVLKIKLHACILMMLDIIASNFLIEGSRFVNKPIDAETLVALGPQLYLNSCHVIQSILSFAPHFMVRQCEDLLRKVLLEVSTKRKCRSGSARVCYATLDHHHHHHHRHYYHYWSPTHSGNEEEISEVDWNRHSFKFQGDELLHLLRTKTPDGETLTKADLDQTIKLLMERSISSPPYIRDAAALDSDEPKLSKPGEHDRCACIYAPGTFCDLHSAISMPIITRFFNGHHEVLLVSTAWLFQKVSSSPMSVINEALHEFFNHQHQPTIKCAGAYSVTHPGTFNVFELEAPKGDDRRKPLQVPNIHKLSSPEFKFMNSRLDQSDMTEDEEEGENEKQEAFFSTSYWVADRFEITEPYDLYVSLERADSMYYCGTEKVTERDLVTTMYSVGTKLGLVDHNSNNSSSSSSVGFEFDPKDPLLLLRYDDENDIDLPVHEHLVPSSSGDPRILVPLWEELNLTFAEYKRTVFTPECTETRTALYQQIAKEPMNFKYPEDARNLLANNDDGIILPLSHQLSVKDHALTKLTEAQYSMRQKQAELRKKLFPNVSAECAVVSPPSPSSSSSSSSSMMISPSLDLVLPRSTHSDAHVMPFLHTDSLVPENLFPLLDSTFCLAQAKYRNAVVCEPSPLFPK